MTAPLSAARHSRKILLPMATLLAAASIAIASGATFSSTSASGASTVTAGTLTQSNSKADVAIFSGTDLKPGDTVTGTATITNTGNLAADFTLTEFGAASGFTAGALTMVIEEGDDVLFDGTFGEANTAIALGRFAAGDARTYTFTTTLDAGAQNVEQGKSATASYRWDAVQAD